MLSAEGRVIVREAIERAQVSASGQRSRGRTLPQNLREQIAMRSVMLNPRFGRPLPIEMSDPRWLASQGWVKMSQNINGAEIHYVYNTKTHMVDDFKFVN